MRTTLPMWAAIAAIVAAPFEVALFALPGGFTVTTLEAAIATALAASALAHVLARKPVRWPTPIVAPGLAFLVVLFTAGLAAPIEQGNALRFCGRMTIAAMVCVVFANVADTPERARRIVQTLLAVATLIGLIAVLEIAQVPGVMSGLTWFRPGFHVVGGQMRATSTLFYPTISSMFLEVAFALGLWLLFDLATRRPRLERALVFVALTLVGAGISATFTRAGLIGLAAALVIVAAARYTRLPGGEAGLSLVAFLASVLTAIVFLSHSSESLLTRLRTEGTQAWYGARYDVPGTLRLATGRTHQILMTVTNTGRLTWDSNRDPAFAMSYHWLRAGSDAVVHFEGNRTAFAAPVRPGARVTLPVSVTAPGEAGDYTLVWDVVHETRAWLSTEGVEPARTRVRVEGATKSVVSTTMDRLPRAGNRPARPQLWRASLQMTGDRPWLGVGPDNFRHLYGRYLGLERWDNRVHANSMYFEMLAGAGILGLATIVWLFAAAGLVLWRRCRRATGAALMPAVAMFTAWLLVAGHGLVDSFLSFTTTYFTFALAAGLAFSRGLSGAQGVQGDQGVDLARRVLSHPDPRMKGGDRRLPDLPVTPEAPDADRV